MAQVVVSAKVKQKFRFSSFSPPSDKREKHHHLSSALILSIHLHPLHSPVSTERFCEHRIPRRVRTAHVCIPKCPLGSSACLVCAFILGASPLLVVEDPVRLCLWIAGAVFSHRLSSTRCSTHWASTMSRLDLTGTNMFGFSSLMSYVVGGSISN